MAGSQEEHLIRALTKFLNFRQHSVTMAVQKGEAPQLEVLVQSIINLFALPLEANFQQVNLLEGVPKGEALLRLSKSFFGPIQLAILQVAHLLWLGYPK